MLAHRLRAVKGCLSYPASMSDWLSDLNDGRHIVYAYCAGKDRGPPYGHSAKLNLAALIQQHGDIVVRELRHRLRCQCGAGRQSR